MKNVQLGDGPVLQFANLRNGGYSGPVFTPGQGSMFPYQDQFGQVAWSHIPPSEGDIKRQPFYHEPMRVEEAKPPLPPSPPPGVIRTLSFAQRQVLRSVLSCQVPSSWQCAGARETKPSAGIGSPKAIIRSRGEEGDALVVSARPCSARLCISLEECAELLSACR